MAKKTPKPKARLPRGFVDRMGADIRAQNRMLDAIAAVYERYGFEPIETPMVEYTDALGKFLPDQDRPNEGVFGFRDDDEQWLSLRYDLTAPLARHVAENWQNLVLPYRTWRAGYVFRNEKPGPGRFRQFMQCDADTIGAPGVQADAEMCMMMADVLEAVGVKRGDYVIRVNNRKVLDGVMEAIGLGGEENAGRRLQVMRELDKIDRLGADEVAKLLGAGRVDDSGAQQLGVGLNTEQSSALLSVLSPVSEVPNPQSLGFKDGETERQLQPFVPKGSDQPVPIRGIAPTFSSVASARLWDFAIQAADGELKQDDPLVLALGETDALRTAAKRSGYEDDRIRIDPSVVRGLEYYTGMVYEAELTFPVVNERGEEVVFGSVGGGGRYDGLVSRFRGETVPACGFSIGVSRLQTALRNLGLLEGTEAPPLVVVCIMDRNEIGVAQALTSTLREAAREQEEADDGTPFRAEMFQGNPKNFGKQLQYADRRNAAVAVFQGSEEREAGTVQIKDLIAGREEAAAIESNEAYRAARVGQRAVPEGDLVAEVLKTLREQAAS